MLWFSKRVPEWIGNGGYLLFADDAKHGQISLLSGAGKCIENLETDLTDFIYGPSVIGTASFLLRTNR